MLIALSPGLAAATQLQVKTAIQGTAIIDGDIGEWDLELDFFADMYRAGKPDKALESRAYLQYDALTETLYVLVLTTPDCEALSVGHEKDAWAAIDNMNNKVFTGNSGKDGVPPDFAWVNDPSTGTVRGYEASFKLARGEYKIIIHIQVLSPVDSEETSATTGLKAGVDLLVVPETAFGTTILSIFAAVGAFALYKKHQTNHTPSY